MAGIVDEKSPASTVIRSYTDRIVSSGLDPFQIARKLFSSGILSSNDYHTITDRRTGQSSRDRLQFLMEQVSISVESDKGVFSTFVKIVRSVGNITSRNLADSLEAALQSEVKKGSASRDPQENIQVMNVILQKVLDSNKELLTLQLETCMPVFTKELSKAGLITSAAAEIPNYDIIMKQFIGGTKFLSNIEEFAITCDKYFQVLSKFGGPLEAASKKIKRQLTEEAKAVGYHLDFGSYPHTAGTVVNVIPQTPQPTNNEDVSTPVPVSSETSSENINKESGGRDDTFLIKQPQQAKDTTTNNAVKLVYPGQQKPVLSEAKGGGNNGHHVKEPSCHSTDLDYSKPIQATLAVEGTIIDNTSDYIQESRSESS